VYIIVCIIAYILYTVYSLSVWNRLHFQLTNLNLISLNQKYDPSAPCYQVIQCTKSSRYFTVSSIDVLYFIQLYYIVHLCNKVVWIFTVKIAVLSVVSLHLSLCINCSMYTVTIHINITIFFTVVCFKIRYDTRNAFHYWINCASGQMLTN